MHDQHEPRNAFVEKLEWQIGLEVKRRNRPPASWRIIPQSSVKAAVALAALVVVSMAIGGGVVAAAYQAKDKEERAVIVNDLDHRVTAARLSLEVARKKLDVTQGQVSIGTARRSDFREGPLKVAEAEASLKSLQLQLEEAQITGHAPLDEISAPLAAGRDFVNERLRIAAPELRVALENEREHLIEIQKQVSLGTTDAFELEPVRARITELDAAMEALEAKLKIRASFLTHYFDAATAELHVLEYEALQRQKTLGAQIEVANKQVERAASLIRPGQASNLARAEAELHLRELQLSLAQAEVELGRVRAQLEQRRQAR